MSLYHVPEVSLHCNMSMQDVPSMSLYVMQDVPLPHARFSSTPCKIQHKMSLPWQTSLYLVQDSPLPRARCPFTSCKIPLYSVQYAPLDSPYLMQDVSLPPTRRLFTTCQLSLTRYRYHLPIIIFFLLSCSLSLMVIGQL